MTDASARLPEAASAAGLEAVLFDMDGVVTRTARAHAAAWKHLFDAYLERRAAERGERIRPFDPDRDYRDYVDGKRRYDGVKSFFSSRGIELPYGSPEDNPDQETICGLGNRKDRHFHAWLDQNPVETFPGTLAFIDALKRRGIKVAVFSSSRNAEAVLRSAGVLSLFDVRLDGNDLARLQLPGKPDPAMLLEAASRLGVLPGRAAVVEDAIAGAEAGARGGFGVVVGVDRAHQAEALRQAGANLVIGDLAELCLTPDNGVAVKTLATLTGFDGCKDRIVARLSGKMPAVFLDYDGTLTPIVEDPEKALLSDEMRAAVVRLAERCSVAIVSGRGLDVLRGFVSLDSVYYAGSHGFEIAGPKGWTDNFEKGVEFLPELDKAERELHEGLAGIAGHQVERKRFSIAVHYRRAREGDALKIEAVVDRVLGERPRLRKGLGKKVFEIRPDIDWDKGRAVLWLLGRLDLDRAGILPIYVGDDITDEDAFRALSGKGLSLVVHDADDRPTAAEYGLADTNDVARFLDFLTGVAKARGEPQR